MHPPEQHLVGPGGMAPLLAGFVLRLLFIDDQIPETPLTAVNRSSAVDRDYAAHLPLPSPTERDRELAENAGTPSDRRRFDFK